MTTRWPRVPYVGVGCLLIRNNRVLLVRRHGAHGAGSWSTPGGHLDFGETPAACAAREVQEETGLRVTDVEFLGITNDIFAEADKHYVTLWMRADPGSDPAMIQAPEEIAELDWFALDALPVPLFQSFANLVRGECVTESAAMPARWRGPAAPPSARPDKPSTPSLSIRPVDLANATETAALISVLDSYAHDVMGGAQPLGREVKEQLPEALRRHPTTLAWLAWIDDSPVGLAIAFLGLSTFHARPLINIHDLAVVPGRRGRGVGRALLEAVEAEARRRGCCKLTLEVREDNTRARAVYGRFGFTDFVVGGTTSPTRFLAKALGPDRRL